MNATVQQQNDKVRFEIDGVAVEAPKGSMIIEAADRVGIDIPRFCYHRKLSIAANCRMCLVDVERAPKPVPACATPVAEGMKVFTDSRRAIAAQQGVMEFLLINHPLDCPVCDQGGECELQDLALGYGRSLSRFTERKRIVADENLGSLIATDMTRCIQCTRCIRFLDEIAGSRELAGIGRGEKLEIKTFIGRSVDSEISGNVIDLCPVGALTNKPFRFRARPWELVARPGVAVHDCVGSNLWYHARQGRLLRAVPRDNEEINETWLSDRDRYSLTALDDAERLTAPEIKVDGEWQPCTWDKALESAAGALDRIRGQHGGGELGFLIAPQAAGEEHYLLHKLARGLGSGNIDHRLRECDFRDQQTLPRHPALGLPIAALDAADAVLLVGSNVRHEQPLLATRLRAAWRRHGARIMALNPLDYEFTFDLAAKRIVAPQYLAGELEALRRALEDGQGSEVLQAIAGHLKTAARPLILLGDLVLQHPAAAELRRIASALAQASGATLGTTAFGNGVGAWLAGAVPHRLPGGAPAPEPGMTAEDMLRRPRRGYLLYGCEPGGDFVAPRLAQAAFAAADSVVAISAFAGADLRAAADVLLPLALFAEAGGTFHNIEGRMQRVAAAVPPPGEARPGWKIVKALADRLGLDDFAFTRMQDVQGEFEAAINTPPAAPPAAQPMTSSSETGAPPAWAMGSEAAGFWRIGDVPAYAGDAQLRRARPLQNTIHGDHRHVALNPADAERLGIGDYAALEQDGGRVVLPVLKLDGVPPGGVWLRAATAAGAALGAAFAPLTVAPAAGPEVA